MSCIDTDLPCGTLGMSAQSHDTKRLLASNELQLPLVNCGELLQISPDARDATISVHFKLKFHVVSIWQQIEAHVAKRL